MRHASPRAVRPGDLTRFGLVTTLATIAYMTVLAIAEQAGVPAEYGFAATGGLLILLFAWGGLSAATASDPVWQDGARRERPLTIGMTVAAVTLATGFAVAIPGLFFAGAPGGVAWIAGPLCGLAIGAAVVAPHLRKAGGISASGYFAIRFRGPWAGLAAAALVLAVSFLMLWSQLRLASTFAMIIFPIPPAVAASMAATLVFLCVAPGGLAGVVRLNSLAFAFAATCFLAPAVWISATTTGLPVPQLTTASTGQAIAVLELQTIAAGGAVATPLVTGLLPGWDDMASALAMTLLLALGFAVLPPLYVSIRSGGKGQAVRKSGAWAILLAGLVLGVAPAAAGYAKLAVLDALLDKTVGDIEAAAPWALQWSRLPSPVEGQAAILVCKEQVLSAEAAVEACGGNPARQLAASDLQISVDAVALALPDMARLPTVFAIVTAAAAVALSIAAASASAFAAASTISGNLFGARMPEMTRLFLQRCAVGVFVAGAGYAAALVPAGPLDPMLHAVGLCAAILAPALLVAIHVDRLSGAGMAVSIAIAAFAYAAWIFVGVESRPSLPGLRDLPTQAAAAAVSFASLLACMAIFAVFHRIRPLPDETDRLEALRAPDRNPEAL